MDEGLLSLLNSLERCLFAKGLKKGSVCWAVFAMKRDNEVSIPFRDWIYFFELGVGNLEKVLHLLGLASIPHSVK